MPEQLMLTITDMQEKNEENIEQEGLVDNKDTDSGLCLFHNLCWAHLHHFHQGDQKSKPETGLAHVVLGPLQYQLYNLCRKE